MPRFLSSGRVVHVVGLIGEAHVGEFAAQHLLDIGQHRGVAAQHAMLAADPQIAGPADRFGRRLRRIIGIAVQLGLDDEQPVEFVLIETGQRQIESGGLQVAEFKPQ